MKRMWSEEEIQSFKKDISNLVDSKGNPRFVEGNGTPATIEGFTSTYCKWSLSGTHLMLVLAGSLTSGTTIPNSTHLVEFNIPKFIKDKIYPVWGNSRIESKSTNFTADNWVVQTATLTLTILENSINITLTSGDFTLTANRAFRIQFDLLIDSE